MEFLLIYPFVLSSCPRATVCGGGCLLSTLPTLWAEAIGFVQKLFSIFCCTKNFHSQNLCDCKSCAASDFFSGSFHPLEQHMFLGAIPLWLSQVKCLKDLSSPSCWCRCAEKRHAVSSGVLMHGSAGFRGERDLTPSYPLTLP